MMILIAINDGQVIDQSFLISKNLAFSQGRFVSDLSCVFFFISTLLHRLLSFYFAYCYLFLFLLLRIMVSPFDRYSIGAVRLISSKTLSKLLFLMTPEKR